MQTKTALDIASRRLVSAVTSLRMLELGAPQDYWDRSEGQG